MPDHRRVSIKDIARAAGVSYSTVSRALNNSPLISKEVRERVQSLAEEMGYTPNALAQSLQSNRSGSIGVIITTISDPFFADVIQGMEEAAREANLTFVLATSNNDPENEVSIIEGFHRRRVDGVIIAASRMSEGYHERLERVRIPVIVINNEAVSRIQDLHSINIDNRSGARLAVQHLLDLGHRRIGYIGMNNRPGSNLRRQQGYLEVLKENGISLAPEWVCSGAANASEGMMGDLNAGRELAAQLLRQGVTAIFCYSDTVAAGALAACQEMNIDVPGQVSIVGFDDNILCQMLHPQLTTIHQPMREMGRAALQMLVDTIAGKPVQDAVVTPTLVIRASTARVAGGDG